VLRDPRVVRHSLGSPAHGVRVCVIAGINESGLIVIALKDLTEIRPCDLDVQGFV
jgi:hypothetical protein